ncbi:MAG: LacI family DNA-binding transcriptional regulator, partial [Phycisphaeraceae bacterium]
MRVTIRDVAREAGVSDTTVSLALRPKSRISDATRQRVLEAAQRLSYVPDRAAQRLRTGASRALGFLVNDLTNPFYARMIRRAGEVARDRAYELTVGESRWDPARELTAAQHMIEARVDGMLACLTERNTETLQRFGQYGVPAVLVDTYPEGYSGAYVANDLIAAGRLAAAHLAEAGCRRLVMFSAQARGRRFSAMRRLEAGFAEGARA